MRLRHADPPDDAFALARFCRERADAEALLVDVVLPDDGLPASEALRAYLRARTDAWQTAAKVVQGAAEVGASWRALEGTLEAALGILGRRRARGPEAAHAVYDTVLERVTAFHAREFDANIGRFLRRSDEHREGEEWKG